MRTSSPVVLSRRGPYAIHRSHRMHSRPLPEGESRSLTNDFVARVGIFIGVFLQEYFMMFREYWRCSESALKQYSTTLYIHAGGQK